MKGGDSRIPFTNCGGTQVGTAAREAGSGGQQTLLEISLKDWRGIKENIGG